VPGDGLRQLYDEIKSVDSRYRNLLTESNRMVKRLKDQKRAEGAQQSNLSAIAALKDAYTGTRTASNAPKPTEAAIEQERLTSEEIRRAQLIRGGVPGLRRHPTGLLRERFLRHPRLFITCSRT
jgi:hypothetical protein